jgi:hypothetical protein
MLLALLLLAPVAGAEPDLRKGFSAGSLTVYPDHRRSSRFYYAPGELQLARTDDDAPDLHLLLMRYTGTVVHGDRGTWVNRSILSFRVRMDGPSAEQLAAVRKALVADGIRRPELRPLPIRRVEAVVVYTPLQETGIAGDESGERLLPEGHFEGSGDSGSSRSYWSERFYTLSLGELDAQLLWSALEQGQVLLSVGYAFFADGIGPEQPLVELTGSAELVAEIRRRTESEPENEAAGNGPHLVAAGAVSITLDAEAWPLLLRRVDVNAQAPPGYAVLDVYCYDFQSQVGEELFEKRVEIIAESVAGTEVRIQASFRRDQPDLYAQTLRFPFAVRIDRPYRFRVISTGLDGLEQVVVGWQERRSWTELLDITGHSVPETGSGVHGEEL